MLRRYGLGLGLGIFRVRGRGLRFFSSFFRDRAHREKSGGMGFGGFYKGGKL